MYIEEVEAKFRPYINPLSCHICTGKSGSSWRMESTGYYKNKNCLSVEFSDDGSILAVIFANSLTLWDPFENQLCTAFDLKSDIKSAKFCHGAQANYIAIATENDVILWDLLAYSGEKEIDTCLCVMQYEHGNCLILILHLIL